jgi:molybdenum-dependent DNA-binding transcriptional regulator ModE
MCSPMTEETSAPTRQKDRWFAHATLEMEAGGKAPGGAMVTTHGHRFAFSGWAELAAAIEDWRATERPRAI